MSSAFCRRGRSHVADEGRDVRRQRPTAEASASWVGQGGSEEFETFGFLAETAWKSLDEEGMHWEQITDAKFLAGHGVLSLDHSCRVMVSAAEPVEPPSKSWAAWTQAFPRSGLSHKSDSVAAGV